MQQRCETFSVASSTSTIPWKHATVTITSDHFITTYRMVTCERGSEGWAEEMIVVSGIPFTAYHTQSVTVDHIVTVLVNFEVEYPSVTEAHLKSITKGIQPTRLEGLPNMEAAAWPDKGLPPGSEHQPPNQTSPQPSISVSFHKTSIKNK